MCSKFGCFSKREVVHLFRRAHFRSQKGMHFHRLTPSLFLMFFLCKGKKGMKKSTRLQPHSRSRSNRVTPKMETRDKKERGTHFEADTLENIKVGQMQRNASVFSRKQSFFGTPKTTKNCSIFARILLIILNNFLNFLFLCFFLLFCIANFQVH